MYITNLESSFQKKKTHSKKGKHNPAGMAFRSRHMGYVRYVDLKFPRAGTCAGTRTPHVPDNYEQKVFDDLLSVRIVFRLKH